MQVYLVRMIEDKTAYGIFWANDVRELFMVIDEKDDPGEFECLILEDSGGLFFDEGFAEWKLGVKERSSVNDPDWRDDEGEDSKKRYAAITRAIDFSETVREMLRNDWEIRGWVPLSKMLERTQR
jgi:hypothetical protein